MAQCLGVNDKSCNNWVDNPEYPNDNICDYCFGQMKIGK